MTQRRRHYGHWGTGRTLSAQHGCIVSRTKERTLKKDPSSCKTRASGWAGQGDSQLSPLHLVGTCPHVHSLDSGEASASVSMLQRGGGTC